jgi:hypothetical protein
MEKVYTTSRITEGKINTSYYNTKEEYCYLKIDEDGDQMWYQNGKLPRVDGPAIIYETGYRVWYQNGKLHRVDGPAIISKNGSQFWYQNGKYHRVDGPAVIWGDGDQYWYIYNIETTKEKIEFLRRKYYYRWKIKMNF